MRLQYPDTIRIIRLPCTGKVDILHILRAFEKGADGVFAVGCLEGDCRFEKGNLRARKKIEKAKQILTSIGIEEERVEMFNLSSGEGPRFAEIATEMTDKVISLGPNPIKGSMKNIAA
jgi:F420-non-reducing hydrogenase iron-sulfur subunit